jgi:hypothetical protein
MVPILPFHHNQCRESEDRNKIMSDKFVGGMDFEEWAALAQRDPESFEALRKKVIEEFLSGVPEEQQHRLRCLQWRIDRQRDISPTPLAACVAISDMMWSSLSGLNSSFQELLTGLVQGNESKPAVLRRRATVLPFKRTQRARAAKSEKRVGK